MTEADEWEAIWRRLRREMVAGIAVSIFAAGVVMFLSDVVLEAAWLFPSLVAAGGVGSVYTARRLMMQLARAVGKTREPPEHEALLARLNEAASAYADLWHLVATILVPLIVAATAATAVLLN